MWVELLFPALLALANALFWYSPSSRYLIGAGTDTYFNIWTFELAWAHLSQFGVTRFFFNGFWQAPIFYPQQLAFALSENQLYPAILTWPLRVFTGNGLLTLSILAFLMNLAAFISGTLWLRSLGARKLAAWGGLCLAMCGWLQKQNLHYQNICIFLIPLALLSWQRFRERPTTLRLIACAFAFGWVGGWNIYFQMFCNLILFSLILYWGWKKRDLRLRLLTLGLLTVAIELPIAWKYLEITSTLGSMAVKDGIFKTFSATLSSPFANLPTLLQSLVPFYPKSSMMIEASGFLGLSWLICMVLACRRKPELRLYLLAAAFAALVSFGPNFGFFYLIRYFPGFHGLRAIGRVQILVMVFSLPAVILFLESLGPKFQFLAMSFILLELLPGAMPLKDGVHPDFYSPKQTPFLNALDQEKSKEPLLAIPSFSSTFQLYMLKTAVPLYGGISGRELTSSFLLEKSFTERPLSSDNLVESLIFSHARRLVSLDPAKTEQLRKYSYLKFQGCFAFYEFNPCLFQVDSGKFQNPKPSILNLEQDGEWDYSEPKNGTELAVLRATRSGFLDFNLLAACALGEQLKFPFLPALRSQWALPFHNFKGFSFKKGDVIMENSSKQIWFSLPKNLRPYKTYAITCTRQR